MTTSELCISQQSFSAVELLVSTFLMTKAKRESSSYMIHNVH